MQLKMLWLKKGGFLLMSLETKEKERKGFCCKHVGGLRMFFKIFTSSQP
jgi:hypothetical protein